MKDQSPHHFDARRDKEIISAGGFWCHACLVAKPRDAISQDTRYCQGCYSFLLKEAEMLPASKRPRWIPKRQLDKTRRPRSLDIIIEPPTDRVTIMSSTTEGQKRGPKHRALPEDLILQLAGEGLRSQAIAAKLKEQDIEVSYRTILRILAGQRVLVA